MKTKLGVIISTLFFWTGLWAGYGMAGVIGDIDEDGQITITEAVGALQVSTGTRVPAYRNKTECQGIMYVDKATGEDIPENGCSPETPYKTISYAVARASACSATTIHITPETYIENIIIKKDHLTLRNKVDDSRAVVIEGSGADVIKIDGARGINLSGMTVQNGKIGIFATANANANLENIEVKNMSDSGVGFTLNSSGFISNCSVQNAAKKGFFIFSDSFVYFLNTISATKNGEQGIGIVSAGAMFHNANITTDSNGWDGLIVTRNSNVTSVQSTLKSKTNSDKGININSNSSLRLLNSNTFLIEGNTAGGIILEQSSTLKIEKSSTLNADNNKERGIAVHSGSILENLGKLYSQGNNGTGIDVWASSSLIMNSSAAELFIRDTVASQLFPGVGLGVYRSSSCTITQGMFVSEKNASLGVDVRGNSMIDCFSSATIQNNDQGGMIVEELSSARMDNTQVINNTNNGIKLFQNSYLRSTGGLSVQGNSNYGIHADDGSSSDLAGPTLQTNGIMDIKLEFESRLTLRGNSVIGTTDYEDMTLVRYR
jgi:hypothetical protein